MFLKNIVQSIASLIIIYPHLTKVGMIVNESANNLLFGGSLTSQVPPLLSLATTSIWNLGGAGVPDFSPALFLSHFQRVMYTSIGYNVGFTYTILYLVIHIIHSL